MKIEILGTGCLKCQKLYENVQQAVGQADIDAEVIKITEINKIMEYGVMITPALVVDGKVKTAGKVPAVEEIKGWIAG